MKILSLLTLVGCVLMVGCKSTVEEDQGDKILYTKEVTSNKSLLFHMSNDDIKWKGGRVGLEPEVTGTPSKILLERGKATTKFLLRGLEDENKFAACHVLLTKMHLDNYFPLGALKWNGLSIKRLDKGQVEIDKAQISNLVKFWEKTLKMKRLEELERKHSE